MFRTYFGVKSVNYFEYLLELTTSLGFLRGGNSFCSGNSQEISQITPDFMYQVSLSNPMHFFVHARYVIQWKDFSCFDKNCRLRQKIFSSRRPFLQCSLFTFPRRRKIMQFESFFDHCMLSPLCTILEMIITFLYSFPPIQRKETLNQKNCRKISTHIIRW